MQCPKFSPKAMGDNKGSCLPIWITVFVKYLYTCLHEVFNCQYRKDEVEAK